MRHPLRIASGSDAAPVAADGPRSARRVILDDVRTRLLHLAAELDGTLPGHDGGQPIVPRLRKLQVDLEVLTRSTEDDREHLAHALRTPLNAIAGWIAVLREHADNPATVRQAADVLARSVSTLARIVDASTR